MNLNWSYRFHHAPWRRLAAPELAGPAVDLVGPEASPSRLARAALPQTQPGNIPAWHQCSRVHLPAGPGGTFQGLDVTLKTNPVWKPDHIFQHWESSGSSVLPIYEPCYHNAGLMWRFNYCLRGQSNQRGTQGLICFTHVLFVLVGFPQFYQTTFKWGLTFRPYSSSNLISSFSKNDTVFRYNLLKIMMDYHKIMNRFTSHIGNLNYSKTKSCSCWR